MLPIILKPRALAMKNRWRSDNANAARTVRDTVIIVFGFIVIAAIFIGTLKALEKIQSFGHMAYLPPSQPLGLILMLLLFSLVITSFATALGTLFLSKDLDLLLSSPLSIRDLFFGKLLLITFHSTWMPMIFLIPCLAAFGVAFNAPVEYYPGSILILFPYFLIPSALGTCLATIITSLIPANKTRWLLLAVVVLGLIAVYMLIELIAGAASGGGGAAEIFHIISMLSMPEAVWLPSHWAANSIKQLLEPTSIGAMPDFLMLICAALSLSALAYILMDQLHARAYSMARNTLSTVIRGGVDLYHAAASVFPFKARGFRALIEKEYRVLGRDMGQAVQLLILFGICLIYIYNLRIFRGIESLPDNIRGSWQGFLSIANVAIGAFVATAMCTRFVFPSISLEGKSFWILQTAPIKIKELLKVKFWSWLVPVGILSNVVFVTGALVIGSGYTVIVMNAVAAWIICYGVVGLAIGLGALFSNFNWEHSSELAASFGSLCFMLGSVVLILVSLIPGGFVIFLAENTPGSLGVSLAEWLLGLAASVLLLLYLNLFAKRIAFRFGEESLLARMD